MNNKKTNKLTISRKKRIKEDLPGIAVSAMLIFFAVILAAVCLYSASKMESDMNILARHPFSVTNSIHEIRQYVTESETQMNRLFIYSESADVEYARDNINSLRKAAEQPLENIIENPVGSMQDGLSLKGLIEDIEMKQDTLLNEALQMSSNEIQMISAERMTPLYQKTYRLTKKMLKDANSMVKDLTEGANDIMQRDILLVSLLALVMIVFSIIFERTIKNRNREKNFNDFLFRLLAENVDTVFMIFNLKSRSLEKIFTNIERLYGISPNELTKDAYALFRYIEPEQGGAAQDLEALFRYEFILQNVEKECILKNPVTGEKIWTMFRIFPVLERGNAVRYIISLDDLTESRKTQQVLREALLTAQDASTAKSDFLSRMSHEIRTPLNAIIGLTSLAGEALDEPEKMKNYLSKVSISSHHLLMLINDILDMSKIESGKMVLAELPFNFSHLINNVVSIISLQSKEKNLDFRVTISELEHEDLIGDSLKVNQVLINILSNSVKFTPEGGLITMDIKELGTHQGNRINMQFTIQDTGIGMNEEALQKMFSPFEQADSNISRKYGGTGLGMAITKNIVTLMNGTIRVSSEEGKGTLFTVVLSFKMENNIRLEDYSNYGDMSVLVVDDDVAACKHTALVLKRIGVVAEWITSGTEAVRRVLEKHEQQQCYDVAFIDWQIPDMDGIEVTRRIREQVGPETMIIVISAYNWVEMEKEALQAGANALITKPLFQSSIYNALAMAKQGSYMSDLTIQENETLSGKRMLVAEDNELNLEIVLEYLKHLGSEAEWAMNGEEVCQKLQDSEPGYYDAILMDIQMPIMDGYRATEKIRRSGHPDAKSIIIIAMTANAFAEDVVLALNSGMNAHIAKPMDMKQLYRVIKDQTEGKS